MAQGAFEDAVQEVLGDGVADSRGFLLEVAAWLRNKLGGALDEAAAEADKLKFAKAQTDEINAWFETHKNLLEVKKDELDVDRKKADLLRRTAAIAEAEEAYTA